MKFSSASLSYIFVNTNYHITIVATMKKLHWVWFGEELPAKYVTNIETMALANPGWEIFLWSEVASLPLRDVLGNHGVQYTFKNVTKGIEEGLFVNGDLISKDRNLAGKSDYLRMEILYLEGGIYQDTDAHPVQPFDNFGGIFRWPFASYLPTSYKVIICLIVVYLYSSE